MAASTSRSDGRRRKPAKAACAWPAEMDRYKPLEKLGAGMNGDVFKAWDSQEKRIVAVKHLSAEGTAGADGLVFSGIAEVAREVRSLRLCHDVPSVVKLLDKVVPAVSVHSFIVMDYAGRLNLRAYMEQRRATSRGRFSEDEVRLIMKQLLGGVRSVHGKGIMHLDMSPENVILDDGTEDKTQMPMPQGDARGEVKEGEHIVYTIGGFAMSRMKGRGPKQPEVTVRTRYSAPELLLGSREYDERVDTWGLGCIMAGLLSGTGDPTFGRDGDPDEEFMSQVFDTVGVKGIKRWPGYSGIAAEAKSKLTKKKQMLARIATKLKSKLLGDPLRLRFPVWRLSSAGFKVLSGLLESNPAKRLTAAEALEMPWFQERE